jgi:hypothetical protein
MSPLAIAAVVIVALMALKLADIYGGGHYVCPTCGARQRNGHSSDCPWRGAR